MNTTKTRTNYNLEAIGSLIHDLTSPQFSILSDIACGSNARQICTKQNITNQTLKLEVCEIKEIMGVDSIKKAVRLYSVWIDELEEEQNDWMGH